MKFSCAQSGASLKSTSSGKGNLSHVIDPIANKPKCRPAVTGQVSQVLTWPLFLQGQSHNAGILVHHQFANRNANTHSLILLAALGNASTRDSEAPLSTSSLGLCMHWLAAKWLILMSPLILIIITEMKRVHLAWWKLISKHIRRSIDFVRPGPCYQVSEVRSC